MSEIEILQYILRSAIMHRSRHGPKVPHFWLREYFRSQKDLIKYESGVYAQLGIKIIPYFRDKRDFEALGILLEDIASTFDVKTKRRIAALGAIDDIIT